MIALIAHCARSTAESGNQIFGGIMNLTQFAFAFLLPIINSSAAPLIHDYQFQNSLADSLGGPSLVSLGGTVGSGTYTFAAQQGLSLSNALPNSADYSLFMNFEFSSVSGYVKIVDFKNLTADNGLYNLTCTLFFFPFPTATTPNTIPAATFFKVPFTRYTAPNTRPGYV